jgi:hypothetical protein
MAQGSENPEDVIGKAALYDAFLAAAPPGLAMRRGPFHVLAAEHFTERNINRGNGSRRYYVGIKLRSNECLTAPYVTGSLFGSATASPSPMAPGTSAEAISTRGAA